MLIMLEIKIPWEARLVQESLNADLENICGVLFHSGKNPLNFCFSFVAEFLKRPSVFLKNWPIVEFFGFYKKSSSFNQSLLTNLGYFLSHVAEKW